LCAPELVGDKVTALFVNEVASFLVGADNHIYTIKHSSYPNGPLSRVDLKEHSIIRRVQQKISVLKVKHRPNISIATAFLVFSMAIFQGSRLLLSSPTEIQLWNLSKGVLLFKFRNLTPIATKFSTFEYNTIIAIGESINIWKATGDLGM